jgi:16S rRNA (cytosine1402-N4)-methyltransferase
MSNYHTPVLLQECLDGLDIKSEGTYVDVTFGGGGHSREILKHIDGGRLYAFDQDQDSQKNAPDNPHFVLIPQNFKYLKNFLRMHNALPADGILADLGVSSHQFDAPMRGFSIRHDGPLDMRMSQDKDLTAEKIVNHYDEDALIRILRDYGEIKSAHRVAKKLIESREEKPIKTTNQLVALLEPLAPFKKRSQFMAQVFQALRIEVNGELDVLRSFLEQTSDCLTSGGRLVIISYHSLEDRLVKNYIRSGNFKGEQKKDLYGNIERPFDPVNRKVIIPNDEELKSNPRSRSAKLRIATRR